MGQDWTQVMHRVAGERSKPASFSIRVYVREGYAVSLPVLIVSFRKSIYDKLDWKPKDEVGLLLGEGDNANKLRIVRGLKPSIAEVRVVIHRGLTFNFGYVERFGDKPTEKIECDASIIDENTVEVELPPREHWKFSQGTPTPAGRPPKSVTPTSPPPKSVPPTSPTVDKVQSRTPIAPVADDKFASELDLPYISTIRDSEYIMFRGKTCEDITSSQAKLLDLLVAEHPKAVDQVRCWIMLWGTKYPATAKATFDTIITGLNKLLGDENIGIAVGREKDKVRLLVLEDA